MKAIYAALVKAQKGFGPALKSSTNPHFRSKYADLSACIEAVVDSLNENGIMLMQKTHEVENGVMIETVFLHESGEEMSAGKLFMPATKFDAQGFGSALSYARRYSIMAACGIAPEDDDGNKATEKDDKKEVEVMSERQIGDFKAKIEATLTKEQAKAEWQKALHACTVIQDLTAHARIKAVLLKHLEFIDAAVK
jgi:hypothetical protein